MDHVNNCPDSGSDNISDNNTSGIIIDSTSAFGSMFDNVGHLWVQYSPVAIRTWNHLWGGPSVVIGNW